MSSNSFRFRNTLMAIMFFLAAIPCLAAPAGATDLGVQGSTNFEEFMVGLKIQTGDIAITPKLGFAIQHFRGVNTGFVLALGFGFDYYFTTWAEGKLRPYVGNDLVMFLSEYVKGTDIWVADDVHLGVEYWLSEQLSFGGNLGIQLGLGNSAYTSGTFNALQPNSSFSLGTCGRLNMTYYF